MRVRDHVGLSTAGAAVLWPWLGRDVLTPWAASILIDSDHYVWFFLSQCRISPVAAVRFFNAADAPHRPATRALHSPVVIAAVLAIGRRRRVARAVVLGMALHVAMDIQHEARMNRARAAALRRDDFTCGPCGARGPHVATHLHRQPLLLPSYRVGDHVTLCDRCHAAAHARGTRGPSALVANLLGTRSGPVVAAREPWR